MSDKTVEYAKEILLQLKAMEKTWNGILQDALNEKVPAEPKFKPGDLVQVVDREGEGEGWITTAFSHLNIDNPFPYVTHIGPYKTCRHAPSWIKWENGDCPTDRDRDVLIEFWNGAKVWYGPVQKFNHDNVKRWAWMPEE